MPNSLFRRFGRPWWLTLPVLALLFSSCITARYYDQRTLFRLTDSQGRKLDSTKLRVAVNRSERNYVIQANDYLDVRVYTNRGERILDPNGDLQLGQPSTVGGGASRGGVVGLGASSGGQSTTAGSTFLVQADGTVVLPLLNRLRISGLTLLQADSMLAVRYNEFYRQSFVTTHVTNNRVIVLGAPGGKVIPLANDNMNLLEVLALAGGIDGGGGAGGLYRNGGTANNIRIIRGDLKNPRVQQIDLSTLDGMRRANLQVEPNDVIYVEPIRRPFLDALADLSPLVGFSSLVLTTTLFLVTQFR